jgi:hypothetical protein
MGTINGVPDVTFPITAAGPTTVTWTYDDGNGNTTTQTQDVYSTMMDLSVSLAGTTITANATGVSYAWIDCGTNQEIAGETGQTYTPSVTGQYAVVITNGTCVDTSECTLVDFTGIEEISKNLIGLYPNPASDVINYIFDGAIEDIIVYDGLGRTVDLSIDLITNSIDVTSLANGKYIMSIITTGSVFRKQFIVTK